MAKPKHASSAATSSSSSCSNIAPSSGILAFLASLSASSVDGHPLDHAAPPPDFLCPSISPDYAPRAPPPKPRRLRSRSDPSSSSDSPKSKRLTRTRPFVPDKYVQGPDGRWRKSENWTLYGHCTPGQCPSSVEYAAVDATATLDNSDPTPAADTAEDLSAMESKLPPGWPARSNDNSVLNAVILTLSLVLAVCICTFMVACIAWRRKRKKRAKEDLEKKYRSSRSSVNTVDSEGEDEEMKRMRSHQRMWARASARWRENVRLSARRRRAQRSMASLNHHAQSSRTSLAESASSSAVDMRPSPVIPSGATPQRSPTPRPMDGEDTERAEAQTPTLPNEESAAPSRPPSYLRESLPPRVDHERYQTIHGRQLDSEPLGVTDAKHRPQEESIVDEPDAADSLPPPPPMLPDAAHVATDDKAILARMAALASAPEDQVHGESSAATGDLLPVAPSVPVMEFEEYDHPEADGTAPPSGLSLPPCPSPSTPVPSYPVDSTSPHEVRNAAQNLLPRPPSKAAPTFYDYPASFEEDYYMSIGLDEHAGPSAPPFDEPGISVLPSVPDGNLLTGDTNDQLAAPAPSAPPLDDDGILPSAPPLSLEEEDFQDTQGRLLSTVSGPAEGQVVEVSTPAPAFPVSELGSNSEADSGRPALLRSPSDSRANPPGYIP